MKRLRVLLALGLFFCCCVSAMMKNLNEIYFPNGVPSKTKKIEKTPITFTSTRPLPKKKVVDFFGCSCCKNKFPFCRCCADGSTGRNDDSSSDSFITSDEEKISLLRGASPVKKVRIGLLECCLKEIRNAFSWLVYCCSRGDELYGGLNSDDPDLNSIWV